MQVLTAATGEQVTAVLDVLKTVVTFLFESITSLVDVVMANPLLLIPIGVILCYTTISVFKRIF